MACHGQGRSEGLGRDLEVMSVTEDQATTGAATAPSAR